MVEMQQKSSINLFQESTALKIKKMSTNKAMMLRTKWGEEEEEGRRIRKGEYISSNTNMNIILNLSSDFVFLS